MQKNYSFLERLTSSTPAFFKRAQAFGAGLAALGLTLTQVHGMPSNLITGLVSIGTTIAAVSQFAVKQCDPLPQDKAN